jgi:hypothetical protein
MFFLSNCAFYNLATMSDPLSAINTLNSPLKELLTNKVIGIVRAVTCKALNPHQNRLILSASLRSISVYFRESINSLLASDGLTMAVPLVVT